MNELERPDAAQRLQPIQFSPRSLLIAVSLLAAAIALVTFNVRFYLHSRSLEYQFQHSLTKVPPWIVPEGASGVFFVAWLLILIVSSVVLFRLRHRVLKYAAGFFAAGAVVALVVNAYCLLWEAFQF